MSSAQVAYGLKGIIALETEISEVDGPNAALYYRGYHIDDIVSHARYEEVAYMLLHGDFPTESELESFQAVMAREQHIPEQVIDFLRTFPAGSVPMAMLRSAVSLLSELDPDAEDSSAEANMRKAVRLTAQVPTLVALIGRIAGGKDPAVEPKQDLSVAANFLYTLNGTLPSETAVDTLDCALSLHAEHGLNASTFAARVTTSTLSDMYSGLTTAIGTLKGPLHGGANEAVMKMLLEIGDPDKAEDYVRAKLERKEVIMGIGHAVYKNGDPRVKHLKTLAKSLCEQTGNSHLFEISERIENLMFTEKNLYPNVDFYSASAYYALGIQPELFTPVFAAARTSGWTAHMLEQYANNVLIRPQAAYIGPTDRKIQK